MKCPTSLVAVLMVVSLVLPGTTWAWGRDGHETVGYLATKLIAGTHAERRVAQLLKPGETLVTAAEWPDCAKGYQYCHVAPTSEMLAFAQRNPRHHHYHYTDVPFQLAAYSDTAPGSDKDDVVHILQDAIHVLKGEPVTDPDHNLTPREALFVLAHMVGDIHQPLHVGAAYINDQEAFVVPQTPEEAKTTFTQGGNWLCHGAKGLHSYWDDDLVVKAMMAAGVTSSEEFAQALFKQTKAVRANRGATTTWPGKWATETLRVAKQHLLTLSVLGEHAQGAKAPCQLSGPRGEEQAWDVELPYGYAAAGTRAARDQLAKAGARLAHVLKAIWP